MAAIVSAIVALAILGLKEWYLEPKRTHDRIRRETLEKRVAAYGTILTLLQTFERRSRELNCPTPHLLDQHDEFPGLQRAIGRSRHLLSDRLAESWIDAVAKFNFEYNTKIGGYTYLYVHLEELQKIVIEEHAELRRQYDRVFAIETNSNERRHNTKHSGVTSPRLIHARLFNSAFVGIVAFFLLLSGITYSVPSTHTIPISFSYFGDHARWDIVMYLKTDVLGAQTPMHATGYALPRNLEGKTISVSNEVIFIYFPGAAWWQAEVPIGAVPNYPYMNLTHRDDGSYLGETKKAFSYKIKGDNGIVASETWVPVIQFPIEAASPLPISGEDVKYQHDSNRIIESLTLATVALGIAASYSFVRKIVYGDTA
ncbi:MAG: hypothetical protein ACREBU_10635 [Nitrososphaera sp.]